MFVLLHPMQVRYQAAPRSDISYQFVFIELFRIFRFYSVLIFILIAAQYRKKPPITSTNHRQITDLARFAFAMRSCLVHLLPGQRTIATQKSVEYLLPSIHMYPMTAIYEPATLADLNNDGDRLMVFCRQCQHFALLNPAKLKLPQHRSFPSLDGLFRCSQCDSRDTAAEPRYATQFINAAQPAGQGWIMPPE